MNEETMNQPTEETVAAEPVAESAKEQAARGPLSPVAMAAFANFLAALDEQDKATLSTLIAHLREIVASQKAAAAAAEEEAMLAGMEGEAAFAGIRDRMGAMRTLMEQVPWLRELPLRDRLAAACYIDRGMQAHTPTPEEKLQAVLSDPALLRALAEKQAALQAQAGRTAPPIISGGHAPATVKKPPKSLAEAKTEAKRFLRAK
jgi:hypothetical protein